MSTRPKTIEIFLRTGDPRGIRRAAITQQVVQVIEVPRSELGAFYAMPESKQVAVYFLFGALEDDSTKAVYIGQTGKPQERLPNHNRDQGKDFWKTALVLVSQANSLTLTHATFLEWHCIQEAKRAGSYVVQNAKDVKIPHAPESLKLDCMEIFEQGTTLLATLGYPLFDSVRGTNDEGMEQPTFLCTASNADGRGVYNSSGFVVLAGSSGRREIAPSLQPSMQRMRDNLIDTGIARIDGDRIVFAKDHAFNSPSAAAIALLGRSANGWTEWKLADGRTLDQIHRSGTSQ